MIQRSHFLRPRAIYFIKCYEQRCILAMQQFFFKNFCSKSFFSKCRSWIFSSAFIWFIYGIAGHTELKVYLVLRPMISHGLRGRLVSGWTRLIYWAASCGRGVDQNAWVRWENIFPYFPVILWLTSGSPQACTSSLVSRSARIRWGCAGCY